MKFFIKKWFEGIINEIRVHVYIAKHTNMNTGEFLQDKLGLIFFTTVNV